MGTATINETLDGSRAALNERRARIEALVELASHLPPADKALIEQIYERGVSANELARATGRCPRSLQRRARNALRRVNSPEYRFLALHGDRLSPDTRRTARLIVFSGLSYRAAADATDTTVHRVRQHLLTLRALAQAVYS